MYNQERQNIRLLPAINKTHKYMYENANYELHVYINNITIIIKIIWKYIIIRIVKSKIPKKIQIKERSSIYN